MSAEAEGGAQSAGGRSRIRIAGAIAGIGSGLTKVGVGHGFDTIKTRLQCAPPGMYNGALDCLMKTIRNESVLALYKGASPPAVGWAMVDSVLLGSLHNYRLLLLRNGMTEPVPDSTSSDDRRLTLFAHGLAGLAAGCTSAFVSHPFELLKVKLQLQMQRSSKDRQFKGPIDCARQVVRAQGPLGLWRGLASGILFRTNFFWMFGSVEVLMRTFSKLNGTRYEMGTGMSTFFAGGLASFTFWFFAMPFDNVKNRILMAPLDAPKRSPLEISRTIYRTVGLRGFYSGMVPVLLRAFPVNSCALFVYEGLMRLMNAEKHHEFKNEQDAESGRDISISMV
ncbi:hypothetical protein BOTBODRAFT_61779 [Botryobasidium botryosum FD-172 SS1]|uniref:Mitochondrial carrier protein n=1 Tax=Botryobasidium botryosum (strain FD-172 SS1) TaxID=930990 RepID=A0A067MYI9_BOTB1|nr:hypothetical protein BOTBODRAFT_61779 [Botryobasidium botryosum FD-172 SS1]